VLRVQQGIVSIRGNVAQAMPTLDLIDEVSKIGYEFENDVKFNDAHQDFIAEVVVEGLSFEYPGRNNSAVKEIEFKIKQGDVVAIIGESGSGKTTLIDLLLGVLEPAQGRIQISGVSPKEAIMKWPGAISYVPQNVEVINGTILENLILGYAIEEVNQLAIERVLKLSSLDDFVSNLPNGINTFVGERGSNVSGGQRQRLGIARALLTCPQLLVLDEATSALDLKTETQITKDITGLRGMTTLIIVAHRINTIINADLVLYLENGKVKGAGNFAEIKHLISHLIDAPDSSLSLIHI
jgi:ABC-type multidrug transport system fused ATPase/permease subunit